jgi:protein gp37
MAENSRIAWCDHTHNLWHGCTKISPGCVNCYAETNSIRFGRNNIWGDGAERYFLSDSYWKQPLRWNRKAEIAGERARVFCGSMCDWLEIHPESKIAVQQAACRHGLFDLIDKTPNLDWLLLSKRLENWGKCVPEQWMFHMPKNVWVGTTVVNDKELRTVYPVLYGIEKVYKPSMVFLSFEPLLERLDLEWWVYQEWCTGFTEPEWDIEPRDTPIWLIAGGESRQRGEARRMPREALLGVIDYGREFDQPVFVKQLGHVLAAEMGIEGKGDDPSKWPVEWRVRQIPIRGDDGEWISVL